MIVDNLATKQDLKEMEIHLVKNLSVQKLDVLNWMFSNGLSVCY